MTASSRQPSAASAAQREVDAIRESSARWLAAVESRDVDQITAIYSDDAAFLVPNALGAFGRAAIRDVWTQLLAAPGLALVWTPISIDVARADDMAFEIGSYELSMDGPNNRHTDSGKYLVVWKRDRGRWHVAADMFNSNRRSS